MVSDEASPKPCKFKPGNVVYILHILPHGDSRLGIVDRVLPTPLPATPTHLRVLTPDSSFTRVFSETDLVLICDSIKDLTPVERLIYSLPNNKLK